MIVTTTPAIEGEVIGEYRGLVSGEAILEANLFRAVIAGILDLPGVRLTNYSQSLAQARETAIGQMTHAACDRGANAVIGVNVDYKTVRVSDAEHLVIIIATGTAVKYVQ